MAIPDRGQSTRKRAGHLSTLPALEAALLTRFIGHRIGEATRVAIPRGQGLLIEGLPIASMVLILLGLDVLAVQAALIGVA
jgi:hypothetical protein